MLAVRRSQTLRMSSETSFRAYAGTSSRPPAFTPGWSALGGRSLFAWAVEHRD